MKKVFFSSLMVLALSTMAFAQQNKQPSKPMQPQVSKPATQQPAQQQPNAQANQSTEKKSHAMTKPRHRKTHKAKKHHTSTK